MRCKGEPSVFSKRLRGLRRAADLTQKQLSERLGLDRSTYAYYETGAISPTFEVLLNMAREFRVTTDYLLGATADDAPSTVIMRQWDAETGKQIWEKQPMTCNNDEERSFLALFRALPNENKHRLLVYCAKLMTGEDLE